uniref:PSP proline-rich domain-containing protein n=1 Tax=Calcidiscus leptoporus TaxID=127549 RepID=A0A7S0NVQ5_9EUKA|mmetsp:Transcript_27440/g.64023  ORF Transcript_27440/g.64023 Transcript_27440/m.64023 type:complete len:517 (+) Transcript_27440:71-1621(+)
MSEEPVKANGLSASDLESDSEATHAGTDTGTDTESVASNRSAERNKRRKERKKASKKALSSARAALADGDSVSTAGSSKDSSAAPLASNEDVQVVYVSQTDDELSTPAMKELRSVFEKFSTAEELTTGVTGDDAAEADNDTVSKVPAAQAEEEGEQKMSKKQKKKLKRLTIAELKQLVLKPEVIEQWDVTAGDPRLLVHLKSYRNTIAVPRHWCQKRKFLQGKRGVEKPPFQLPDFIQATGIEKIRATVMEKENAKKLKGKQKERMQPKMGKIDIDYQVLHDAFFKYQTKPRLSGHGDTYYEGKEQEAVLREKKPGQVSEALSKALGMEAGGPPPWLVNMQRYGPPPSYPNLKIPGLNAPIPEGASYGYHPGGWGKPPVDEFGRPLYGDVFGTAAPEPEDQVQANFSRDAWGAMEEGDDEEDEDEDEEDDDDETATDDRSSVTEDEINAGISSVSSVRSALRRPTPSRARMSLVLRFRNIAARSTFRRPLNHASSLPPIWSGFEWSLVATRTCENV